MATVTTTPFELVGIDGGPLRGDARTAGSGRGRAAVIVCHGFKGFKDWGFFPPLAHRLANAGLTVVTFNFSGSGVGPDGESFSELERFGRATHSGDLADLTTVHRALRDGRLHADLPAPPRIGLFGHSRGGGTATLFASDNEVTALVTWAAIGTVHRWSPEMIAEWRASGRLDIVNARTKQTLPLYEDLLTDITTHGAGRLNIEAAARRLRCPWLIVHGGKDEAVPVQEARSLADHSSADLVELMIVPDGGHTFGARHPWGGWTPELERVADATVYFFTHHLM